MRRRILLLLLCGFLFTCNKKADDVIDDKNTNLQWSKNLSSHEMEWEAARKYCSNLKLAGVEDWRLPTKAELETTIIRDLKDKNPESTERPFHGPFIVEIDGYIFSGTHVEGYKDAPYVMRLANGHIFNGKGYKAYARCVRDKSFN